LLESQGDWEAVFYRVLARSLGGKVNAQAMDTLCSAAPLSLIRKMQEDPFQLEAFLLGQAGLLPSKTQDAYVQALIKEGFGRPKEWTALLLLERQVSSAAALKQVHGEFVSIWAEAIQMSAANVPSAKIISMARMAHAISYGWY
jgi:hypothetical protein